MLKFAPRSNKHFHLAIKKERKIRVYRFLLTLPGTKKNINSYVWKYIFSFHNYYKACSSLSHTSKVCAMTSRTRGIYRSFQLSRMKIRETVGAGMFFGISKSSW